MPTWNCVEADQEKVEQIAAVGLRATASLTEAPGSHAYLGTAAYVHGCRWWNPPAGDFPGQIRVDLRLLDPKRIEADPDLMPQTHTLVADGAFFLGKPGEEDDRYKWGTKEDFYLATPSTVEQTIASMAAGSCAYAGAISANACDVNPEFYTWLNIAREREAAGSITCVDAEPSDAKTCLLSWQAMSLFFPETQNSPVDAGQRGLMLSSTSVGPNEDQPWRPANEIW